MPTLKDLVEANPEIAAEIKALEAAAEKKGSDAVIARANVAIPILTSTVYPEPVKAIAGEFIASTKTEAEFRGTVAGFDSAIEAARAAAAEAETAEAIETPPPPPDAIKPDGIVKDEESFQAAQAAFKAARGEQ